MAELGTMAIIVALILAVYGISITFAGFKFQNDRWILSGKRATLSIPVALGLATLVLVLAFLNNDFSIKYVAQHSSLSMPRIYTWVAFYAGNEGSLLFVAFSLSFVSAIAISRSKISTGNHFAATNLVLLLIIGFFVLVLSVLANPFSQLPSTPIDGQGINPLLTHPGMFIHPPLIMTGLIIIAIPFSNAMGALISGQIDDQWVDSGRFWGLIAWSMLGIGLLLGAWWAYTILGWGGYWAWDPVENAAFMPWLGMTAFIHSIMVQKRRGMFRLWNIVLINISFSLGAFGIFINRGGPVPSVHSFGASTLGWVFLIFLGITVLGSFGIFFYRLAYLKSKTNLESYMSRESSFLVNNLLLLSVAFITLWGVVFPLISELWTGTTLTVGEPFFNKLNGPLLLALIVLMGVGPLLPWRRSTKKSVMNALAIPLLITLVFFVTLLLYKVHKPVALISFTASFFVLASISQEWVRGTISLSKSGGHHNYLISFVKLLSGNRPRYGGYIVHIGIVLLAFGIIGSQFYNLEKDVILSPGQTATIGNYQIKFSGTTTVPFNDRTERTALMEVSKNGTLVTRINAWQALYPSFSMLSTRAAIHSTPKEDIYIMFSELQPDGKSAVFRLLINPLVWWMWVAGPFVILGTLLALWPISRKNIQIETS